MSEALRVLKTHFGYDSFRPQQEDIINSIMSNRDTVVLMPTGGGKSICYQIPALLKNGVTIVVSPLISLMTDQVEGLIANGIPACALNSAMSESNSFIIRQKCKQGYYKLIYISPERLQSELNYLLREMNIALFAIDEAHCISHWGHDFRPEYMQLQVLRESFPKVPIMALTATADKITRSDIVKQLKLDAPNVFISSFDRPNISLDVRSGYQQREKQKTILNFIAKHRNESGIIYCMSRTKTEKMAEFLLRNHISAAVYHAGLSPATRNITQRDFINDKVQVICATIAFGMGIDKSNVRWVIHYNLPKSMESFYQEIGRAGRDGLKSDTLLFYSVGDIILLEKFIAESGQQEVNKEKLRRMRQYAEANICRRRILLSYFNEEMDHDCGNCDVCKNPPKRFDGTIIVQKALSAIARTNESIGRKTLIDILKGYTTNDVMKHGYHHLKTFGVGKDLSTQEWEVYILQMLNMGYIEIAYDNYNHLLITEAGKRILFGKESTYLVSITQEQLKPQKKGKLKTNIQVAATLSLNEENTNPVYFEKLRVLRKQLADEQGIPAYLIFSDKTLQLIAHHLPCTMEEFGRVNGVGEYKCQKYGKTFISLIKRITDK